MNYFSDLQEISHHRTFLDDHIRKESFELEYCWTILVTSEEFSHHWAFLDNHIRKESFQGEYCWTISVTSNKSLTIERFEENTPAMHHSKWIAVQLSSKYEEKYFNFCWSCRLDRDWVYWQRLHSIAVCKP